MRAAAVDLAAGEPDDSVPALAPIPARFPPALAPASDDEVRPPDPLAVSQAAAASAGAAEASSVGTTTPNITNSGTTAPKMENSPLPRSAQAITLCTPSLTACSVNSRRPTSPSP